MVLEENTDNKLGESKILYVSVVGEILSLLPLTPIKMYPALEGDWDFTSSNHSVPVHTFFCNAMNSMNSL